MWDMTARGVAWRAMTSGGARGIVSSVNTSTMMSEMSGSMFQGESRNNMEIFEGFGMTAGIISQNSDGVAEALMAFPTGSRTHSVAGQINDRRYRPLGLGQGESMQYDDIGQGTLIRRTGVYILAMDGQGGANAETPGASNSGRFASLRHVNKSKQPRPSGMINSTAASQTAATTSSYKHEGESVNTEVRCSATQVQILDGTTVIAVYDKSAKSWTFTSEGPTTITAKGALNLNGDLINLNGGGAAVPPFSVSK